MILMLSATDERLLTGVVRAAASDELRVVANWQELCKLASQARACIVPMDLRGPGLTDLRALKVAARGTPILLITANEPENTVRLKDVQLDEVVYSDRVQLELAIKTAQLLDRDPLESIARTIETAAVPEVSLRHRLAAVCRSERLPGTVKSAARRMHIGRSTIYNHWPMSWRERGLTPGDFLDLLRLLRAVHLRHSVANWDEAARGVGAGNATLKGWASRYCGATSLKELERPGWVVKLVSELEAKLRAA